MVLISAHISGSDGCFDGTTGQTSSSIGAEQFVVSITGFVRLLLLFLQLFHSHPSCLGSGLSSGGQTRLGLIQ